MKKLKVVLESAMKKDPVALKETLDKELAARGNKKIDNKIKEKLSK